MDLTLAKTIEGLSEYVGNIKPDLIAVHGDRVETLAGAIVGSLNNILVAHIEGGEISGTVDELIRHSVSKLSHVHFVANEEAANRLLQMGEVKESIFEIGSPDVDIMFSEELPAIKTVRDYYQIPFEQFGILLYHPVTTEVKHLERDLNILLNSLENLDEKFVVIYPNNDLGSSKIINEYIKRLKPLSNFRIIPSLRFEYFLSLLKNSDFIIGNSSAGVREAPYYNIPVINVGSRQNNRSRNTDIINVNFDENEISNAVNSVMKSGKSSEKNKEFGKGNSAELFLNYLVDGEIWDINHQKQFKDLN